MKMNFLNCIRKSNQPTNKIQYTIYNIQYTIYNIIVSVGLYVMNVLGYELLYIQLSHTKYMNYMIYHIQ